MTASDKCTNLIKYVLLCRSHPHRTFAAIWIEVCCVGKAAIDYGGANGCFSNTAPAAKSAMGGFRNFAALRSKDSFGARF